MAENAENEALTEEQHEALAWLCRFRHEWHTSMDALFNTESAEYDSLWPEYEQINEKLSASGLDTISGLPDIADFGCSEDYWCCGDFPTYDDWIDKSGAYENFCDMHNDVNNIIERYLQSIDKKYGTSYCPSGATRLY